MMMGRLHTAIRADRARAAIGAILLTLALAVPASALTIYGEPGGGWGFDPAVAASSGVGFLPDQASFLFTPTVDISVTQPPMFPGSLGTSFLNPSTGSTTWTVTANDRSYSGLWVVIAGHAQTSDPHGPAGDGFYASANVGLDFDDTDPDWRFVRFAGTNITYLAYFVGDLAQGTSTVVPIEYRVAQDLFEAWENEFLFPQLQVGFLEAAVPEPTTTMLGLAIVAFGGLKRARRRRETV